MGYFPANGAALDEVAVVDPLRAPDGAALEALGEAVTQDDHSCALATERLRAALADVSANESGTASGVNNAVARIGSLIAIILLPLIGGLAASQAQGLQTGVDILDGYRTSMFAAAAICVFGAGLAAVGFNRSDGRVVATEAAGR